MSKLYVISEKWISQQMTELVELQEAAIGANDMSKVLGCEIQMTILRKVVTNSKDAEVLFKAAWDARDSMAWSGKLDYLSSDNGKQKAGSVYYEEHVQSFNKPKLDATDSPKG